VSLCVTVSLAELRLEAFLPAPRGAWPGLPGRFLCWVDVVADRVLLFRIGVAGLALTRLSPEGSNLPSPA